jgi:hypothetical protein
MSIKRTVCSAVVVAALGLFSAASADVINLTDVTTFTATGSISPEDLLFAKGTVNILDMKSGSNVDELAWKHQFTYDPMFDKILTADLELFFTDINGTQNKTEHVKILLEDGKTNYETLIQGSDGVIDWSPTVDVSLIAVEDGVFEVHLRNQAANTAIQVDRSILSISYESVPEPSILSLFGLSLFGLGFIRRKKK